MQALCTRDKMWYSEAMNSGGDSDRQQDKKARKSLRSDEGIGTEQPVSPEEILPGGETAYLKQLKATHRARACAAKRWRPRLLKNLAMSFSLTDALKAAHVCYNTVRAHERSDPEFAAQLREAEQEGAELLHSVCWKSAIEGNVEPVFFLGQIVGHIRKYDSRMQIELLRAHMPHLFKTPGSGQPLIAGDNNRVMIMTPERQDELIRLRREALEAMNPPKQLTPPNGGVSDSSIDST
jgi:hypothetical protein